MSILFHPRRNCLLEDKAGKTDTYINIFFNNKIPYGQNCFGFLSKVIVHPKMIYSTPW